MKRLLGTTLFFSLFILAVNGQNLTGTTLTLRGWRVDSIGRDTLFLGANFRQLATTLAVKKYVDKSILDAAFGGSIPAHTVLANATASSAGATPVTLGAGLGFSSGQLVNTGDTDGSDDITTSTSAAGDVSGTFPTLTVTKLQGNPVSASSPASGNVLSWDGSAWAPAAVSTGSKDYEEFDNVSGSNITPITSTIPATNREWRINLYRTGVRLTYLKDFTVSGSDLVLVVAAQAEDFVLIIEN